MRSSSYTDRDWIEGHVLLINPHFVIPDGKMKSTKVQTLGELRMCGIPKIDGLGYLRLLAVSR